MIELQMPKNLSACWLPALSCLVDLQAKTIPASKPPAIAAIEKVKEMQVSRDRFLP